MKSFINVEDLGPLDKAMAEAFEIKNDRYKYQHLGKNKTLMMIFFNNFAPHPSQHPEGSNELRHECNCA